MDSKSTAGDSVPVRVRSPAPKKRTPTGGSLFWYSGGDGLEPIQMQQSGGLLPPGVSAGCSIVRSRPAAGTIAQNPWFSGGLGFFFPFLPVWGERRPYRFAAALSGDNRRSDPNILPQTGFLHKFFSVSFRLFSAGQSKIETQHTGRSQRVRGNGVPAVTVHRAYRPKRQTTDHHRPAV